MYQPTLWDFVLGSLPMLLLVGAWFFFTHRMRGKEDYFGLQLRQTEALERIASALEKRAP